MNAQEAKAILEKLDALSGEVQRLHHRFDDVQEQLRDLRTELVILRATSIAPPQTTSPQVLSTPGFGSPAAPECHPAPPLERPRGRNPSLGYGGQYRFRGARTAMPPHGITENARLLPFALESIVAESRRLKGTVGMKSW
jgi:hypothetical protein